MKEFVDKLISRLEEESDFFGGEPMGSLQKHFYCEGVKKSIEIVNQVAEEYNNGWIPCSERLPEEMQSVLVTDKNGGICATINFPYVDGVNDFKNGYYIAWMPLPAPYQKEGDK